MELRQLRYFIAVCAQGSVASAARSLHIAQPALSRQIAALEDEFGTKLLIRLPRGVALTRAGETFLMYAKDVLGSTDALRAQVTLAASGKVGLLRIGLMPGYSWLPALEQAITRLSHDSPKTEILIKPGLSIEQLDAIKRHEIDAGIVGWRSPLDGALSGVKIYQDQVALAMPASVASSCSDTPLLQELVGQDFILFPREISPSYYDLMMRALKGAGISVGRPGVVASDIPTIVGLVSAGLGCAIVPSSYQYHCPANVVIKEVVGLDLSFDLELVWRTDSTDPLLKCFVRMFESR